MGELLRLVQMKSFAVYVQSNEICLKNVLKKETMISIFSSSKINEFLKLTSLGPLTNGKILDLFKLEGFETEIQNNGNRIIANE